MDELYDPKLDKMLHETLDLYFPSIEYFKVKSLKHQRNKLRGYENWLRPHLINECRLQIKRDLLKGFAE